MRTTYIASGVVGNSDIAKGPNLRSQEYESELPEDESHNGVQGIRLEAFGDSTDSAFLEVHGPDENAVTERWKYISDSIDFIRIWGAK